MHACSTWSILTTMSGLRLSRTLSVVPSSSNLRTPPRPSRRTKWLSSSTCADKTAPLTGPRMDSPKPCGRPLRAISSPSPKSLGSRSAKSQTLPRTLVLRFCTVTPSWRFSTMLLVVNGTVRRTCARTSRPLSFRRVWLVTQLVHPRLPVPCTRNNSALKTAVNWALKSLSTSSLSPSRWKVTKFLWNCLQSPRSMPFWEPMVFVLQSPTALILPATL
mmetsp:Transcript_7111/g.14038  ORF Transcript_7111/g.14038 Transcript_7111/m.14038 type:complete len:218 (+) Transcript_7111:2728-3381(+)